MFKLITLLTLLALPTQAGLLPKRNVEADLVEGLSTNRNFVRNGDAEQNLKGWATYADAAGATPVNGTGGAPTVTLTRSTAATPLAGAASFLITKDAANRQGEGASYDFTVDYADSTNAPQNLMLDFYYETGGTFTTGASSDVRIYIYDVTNSALITPASTIIPAASGRFTTTFLPVDTSTSYRLIFHVATTSASAWTLKFDRVKVAPLTPSFTNTGAASTAILTAGNGFGSTNTNVRRYTNVATTGTGITCTDSATNGTSCTIVEDGVWSMNRLDKNTGAASNFGIAKNDDCTAGSGMPSVATGQQMSYVQAGSNLAVNAPNPGADLVAGDVIRACDDSGNKTNETSATTSKLLITKVRDASLPSSYIVATGGTITTDGNFKVHTFTSSGTFQILSGAGTVASLVVAGGGGGGTGESGSGGGGGGGGAGGMIYTTPGALYGTGSYTVTVGAGGATNSNGGNSVFDTITATGGGGAPAYPSAGNNGGSGAGGSSSLAGGTGTVGQGNNGGTGGGSTNGAGGGGGAGAVGANASGGTAGNGGAGVANSITGASVTYACGGGGGTYQVGAGGVAGTGGCASAGNGGAGANVGGNATANTGSGGGGGGNNTSAGGTGGSGVVIVRYQFQ